MLFQIAMALYYSSCFSVVIPLFLFLLNRKQNFKIPVLQILFILLVLSGSSDLINYILHYTIGKTTNVVANVYIIIEFFIFSYIYAGFLKNKRVVYIGVILYAIFLVINTLFIQSFYEFQGWSRSVRAIILIVYAINFFRMAFTMSDMDERWKIISPTAIWINAAVIFYFGFNLFLFIYSTYVFTKMSTNVAMAFWSFHNILNITKNILLGIAIFFSDDLVKRSPEK